MAHRTTCLRFFRNQSTRRRRRTASDAPPVRLLVTPLLYLMVLISGASPTRAAVRLSAQPDGEQPIGEPLVLTITVTNTGDQPVRWWDEGPGRYPPAEHFLVDARLSGTDEWRRVPATNGQYTYQRFGADRELRGGRSVAVPLAVPLDGRPDGVTLRITTAKWEADMPAELYVRLSENRTALDERRARMIEGAFATASPFWQHLAKQHADAVVVDAMLKLVTLDNAPLAGGAARVLAAQPDLPEHAGDILAPLLAQWLPRYREPGQHLVGHHLLHAGLKTRSDAVRRVALDLLRDSTDARMRQMLVDELRLSPGGEPWLLQVRDALLGVAQAPATDAALAKQARHGADWVESRLRRLDEGRAVE